MSLLPRIWSLPIILNNLPLECEKAIKNRVMKVQSARTYINSLEPQDLRNAEENPIFNQPYILVWSISQNKPVVSFNVNEQYMGPSNRVKFQQFLDRICENAYKNIN